MMKLLNVLFAVAICTVFLLLAFHADAPGTTRVPNPMKVNQEQFTRMQNVYYAESVK